MKKTVITVLLSIMGYYGLVNAQTPRSINLELFGVHNLVGVSFDSRFHENTKFGYKIGLGYGHETPSSSGFYFKTSPVGLRGLVIKDVLSIPVSAYYLFGKTNHFFELGAGLVPYYASFLRADVIYGTNNFRQFNYYGFLQTAYRYEGRKILCSIGIDFPFVTPGSRFTQAIGIYPKLSVGYRL